VCVCPPLAQELCEPLKTNKWCRLLRLDCFAFTGYIGDVGAGALAEALMVNSVLQALNLRGNRVGDDGAALLGKALKKNRTLQSLNLDGNQITKQGAIQLLACIMGDATNPPNEVMKELNLQFNKIPELESGKVCNCEVTADIV
jgi:Ran GTPase-activating protein (RanGAP) involved in mRNA processing and transport